MVRRDDNDTRLTGNPIGKKFRSKKRGWVMGVLTDDITRLVGEITTGRRSRAELIKGLRRGAKDLGEEVLLMRSRFQQNHHNMARETRSERMYFVSGMDKTVTSLLQSFNSDLAGARRAWYGLSPK